MINGYVDASVTVAAVTNRDKDAYIAAGQAAQVLKNDIDDLLNEPDLDETFDDFSTKRLTNSAENEKAIK